MAIYNIILAVLPVLAVVAGSPLIQERAGGPEAIPIPANCTTINPLPHASCGVGNVSGYRVSDEFSKANAGYYAYYGATGSVAEASDFCFKQTYGYGSRGTYKAAVFAYNAPTPKGYFGSKGGELTNACLMYKKPLTPLDFVKAEDGQFTNATAISIYCPA
ncbi:uncharacterized protein K489DRAFT_413395 [Dissoconium aciculare CBS 342.82]|uniref:Uncharacterized protein n=1 Tax=Dissoconium aciculare CBS 342.82 TaxID=1314786 RepID=A0A6J3LT40_9PEZI|nr:uncharacterized protein K489DRAFT_413395 [Dissoconium aciculare CBS 342.82]KAF1818955.1 hypothetical protein K489DRAFT_413395 [Dissoconium aciculare CBS 342.82]